MRDWMEGRRFEIDLRQENKVSLREDAKIFSPFWLC